MKCRIVYICFWMLMIVLLSPISRVAAASHLSDDIAKLMPNEILFLEDTEGKLTIDEVASVRLEEFQNVPSSIPNFGYTSSVYWLTFTVKNDSLSRDWLLEIDAPPLDYVTIYHSKYR